MKYRSDIIIFTIPISYSKENIHLYCVVPKCNFISRGLFKKNIISDAFAWGNRETMHIYCNTYNYCIEKIKEYKGKYYVAGECSLTDCIYENNVQVSYLTINYSLDKNRRMFDNIHEDSRTMISNQEYILKITDEDSIKHIDADKQE